MYKCTEHFIRAETNIEIIADTGLIGLWFIFGPTIT